MKRKEVCLCVCVCVCVCARMCNCIVYVRKLRRWMATNKKKGKKGALSQLNVTTDMLKSKSTQNVPLVIMAVWLL